MNGAPGGLTGWFDTHPWVSFAIIFVLLIYIYNKVFRTRRLPILKNLIVYVLLALGAFLLLIFQIDMGLPILYSLFTASALMLVVRIRYWIAGMRKQPKSQGGSD